HTCSLREREAWCWGANYKGELGRGESGNFGLEAAPMHAVDVAAVAVGPFDICAIARDRTLSCAGLNNASQLARTEDEDAHPEPIAIPGVENVVEVAIGGWHMCALLSDGSVRCWGATLWGKLGAGPLGVDYM